MAMADAGDQRQRLAAAIRAELTRQGRGADIDIDGLAQAIEVALAAPVPLNQGKHPDELNATNDD